MNEIDNAHNKIQMLLDDNNFTAYNIEKETGVPHSKISELRNRKRKIDGLTLIVARKLIKYYDSNKKGD